MGSNRVETAGANATSALARNYQTDEANMIPGIIVLVLLRFGFLDALDLHQGCLTMQLVVFMEPQEKRQFEASGTFQCKPESIGHSVRKFCKAKNQLSYSDVFVSIAVLRDDELPCESPAYVYAMKERSELAALDFAILRQTNEVLSSIELVGRDDLKQILTSIVDRWERGVPYASLLDQIRDLRHVGIDQRSSVMLTMTHRRGHHDYTEARLSRPLTISEVESWGKCDSIDGEPEDMDHPGEDLASYFR